MRAFSAKAEKVFGEIRGALCAFYEEGDDADPVRVALDVLAALAPGKAKLRDKSRDLVLVLRGQEASPELLKAVERLYELAEAGEYGSGLSEEEAEELNLIVDGCADDLIEFIRSRLLASPMKKKAPGRTSKRKA